MPTLKGQMFTPRGKTREYGLLDAFGAGIAIVWKATGRWNILARLDRAMAPAAMENVMPKYLRDETSQILAPHRRNAKPDEPDALFLGSTIDLVSAAGLADARHQDRGAETPPTGENGKDHVQLDKAG